MPRTPLRLAPIGAFALLIAAVGACAAPSGSPISTAPPATAGTAASTAAPSDTAPSESATADAGSAITIKDFKFSPAALTVPVGTTVTWTNEEDSLHTVTAGTPDSPSGLFDSGEIDTGVEFPITFDKPGTYPFFCARHDFMKGVVTVTP